MPTGQLATIATAIDQAYARDFRAVFQEDVDILGAQQANLDRHAGASYIDINTDGPGLAFRRMIEDRIAAERGADGRLTA